MIQHLPDFSAKASKKVLLKETLLHPLTLYAGGAGLLSLLGIGLFGANWLNGSIAMVTIAISFGTWIFNYCARSELYIGRHLESLQKIMESQKKALTEKLSGSLAQIVPTGGTEDLVKQARAQFPMVNSKFEGFKSLLADKFAPTEITYGRYLGSGEQIYLSVLDQLNQVVTLFKSIEATDLKYTKNRMDDLRKNLTSLSSDDRDELVALEKRVKIMEDSIREIDRILSRNEEGLTALDLARSSIASIKTAKGQATAQLPDAIKDLEELAQRAKQYSINNS